MSFQKVRAYSGYASWRGMIYRCTNSRHKAYKHYGGRGIKVCERWLGPDGLKHFAADMGERPAGRTLDRVNNDGPYSPENCRWASRQEQKNNRAITVKATVGGETLPLSEWAKRSGVTYRTLLNRRHRGWPDEQLLLTALPHSERRRSRRGRAPCDPAPSDGLSRASRSGSGGFDDQQDGENVIGGRNRTTSGAIGQP